VVAPCRWLSAMPPYPLDLARRSAMTVALRLLAVGCPAARSVAELRASLAQVQAHGWE